MTPETLKLLLTPVIIGIVEALKPTGLLGIDNRFAPVFSIVLGGLGGFAVGAANGSTNPVMDLMSGLGIGAAATGGYAVITSIGSGTTTVTAPTTTGTPSATTN